MTRNPERAFTTGTIDAYVRAVDQRIPSGLRWGRRRMLLELHDGLEDAERYYVEKGIRPDAASQRAVTESGPPGAVAEAFARQLAETTAKRSTIALLASGPMVGMMWAAGLIPGRPPTEMLVEFPALGPVIAISIIFAILTLVMTGPARLRPGYRGGAPHRTAAVAWSAAGIGDAVILVSAAVSLVTAPTEVALIPVCVAACLSLGRAALARHLTTHQFAA